MKVTVTEAYTEYDTGTAIVRVHDGKRTEEEREAAIKEAAKRYLKAVYAAQGVVS